ncbi:transposase [Streptomyces platensis]
MEHDLQKLRPLAEGRGLGARPRAGPGDGSPGRRRRLDRVDRLYDRACPPARPGRLLADKGYPSRANRAWLRERGIATTIPERDDQIAHRRKRPGRPIDFGDEQRQRYRGRNLVERCFNKLKPWRGLAMRSDKTARNHHSGQCLAATLHWAQTFSNTA